MRIAVLHPYSWPEVRRGGERYAHDLAWWLGRQGHAVDYVTGGGPRSIAAVVEGVRLVRLGAGQHRRLEQRGYSPLDTFGLTVTPWLLRHRYDVVHAMVPAAAITAAALRQRVVYTAIGHPAPLDLPHRRKDRRMFRRAVRSAAVTTALSRSAADAALAVAGVRPRVLSPGLRLDLFTPEHRPREAAPVVLFAAAADDPRKRLKLVLEAMPAVLAAHPDARLLVGGPGDLPDSLDPEVSAAIDAPGVGSTSDVVERYRNATVTVLPSLNEAFGLVLAESLACGTPVVGADSGSLPELVTPAVGRLAAADDPDDLARAIIDVVSLAADPATADRCVDRAAQWSWDVVGPQHLAAYETALRT